MSKPTKLVLNCATGEESVVELTDEEIAQMEADSAAWAVQEAARASATAAKAAAKAAAHEKLAALGLTTEEIAAL